VHSSRVGAIWKRDLAKDLARPRKERVGEVVRAPRFDALEMTV
jgi:hypothetical protein